jgi:hypothetical protein
MAIEFKPFPKIPRLFRGLTITEKIDGTNAAVIVTDTGEVAAQSRNRLIYPGKQDHFCFAAWVADHSKELLGLGVGHHYGEWWGRGIGRGYGREDRTFSLFPTRQRDQVPTCCSVVPVLAEEAVFENIPRILYELREEGSKAAPGFMKPEGIVVFHSASRQVYKVLLENDNQPKGLVDNVPRWDIPVGVNQRAVFHDLQPPEPPRVDVVNVPRVARRWTARNGMVFFQTLWPGDPQMGPEGGEPFRDGQVDWGGHIFWDNEWHFIPDWDGPHF